MVELIILEEKSVLKYEDKVHDYIERRIAQRKVLKNILFLFQAQRYCKGLRCEIEKEYGKPFSKGDIFFREYTNMSYKKGFELRYDSPVCQLEHIVGEECDFFQVKKPRGDIRNIIDTGLKRAEVEDIKIFPFIVDPGLIERSYLESIKEVKISVYHS